MRGIVFAAVVFCTARIALADDRDAFSTTVVAPNIMFLLDDSGSMADLSCEDFQSPCYTPPSGSGADMSLISETGLTGVKLCRSSSVDLLNYTSSVTYPYPDADYLEPGQSGYPSGGNDVNYVSSSVYDGNYSLQASSITAYCEDASTFPNCQQRSRCLYSMQKYGYFFETTSCYGTGDPMGMCPDSLSTQNARSCATSPGTKTADGGACTSSTACACGVCTSSVCQECSTSSQCGSGETCAVDAGGQHRCLKSSSSGNPMMTGNMMNLYPPKYVSARAVLKGVVRNFTSTDNIRERMGLTVYNSNSQGGLIESALGPTCANSCVNGACDASFESWRNGTNGIANIIGTLDFSTNTPLGETLDDIGCYYTDGHGPTCTVTYAGSGSNPTRPQKSDSAVCESCQKNFAVFITDGYPTNDGPYDGGLNQAADSSHSNGHEPVTLSYYSNIATMLADDPEYYLLPVVAKNLYSHDLDTTTTGTQNIVSYAVSYGAYDPGDPSNCAGVLARAASNGGGQCFLAKNANDLTTALASILAQIDSRVRSFTAPSLQSTRSEGDNSAEVAIFRPDAKGPLWEGHLYDFNIWDDALKGGPPPGVTATSPNEIFIVDENNKPISFDNSGNLLSQPFWDAALCLAGDVANTQPVLNPQDPFNEDVSACYRSGDETQANARQIFTHVTGSGSTADPFTIANEAALHTQLGLPASVGLCAPALSTTSCEGQKIIGYYRGLDELDVAGRGTVFPVLDRNLSTLGQSPGWWKLGDSFHSSPVAISAPSEYNTFSPYGGSTGSYAAFSALNVNRVRQVLIGANDGMIHDFQGGALVSGTYDSGTGEELWAFVPSHHLAKMASMLNCPTNQTTPCTVAVNYNYFVDGTPQVRDAYTGQTSGLGSVTSLNSSANAGLWKTIAVVGDRDGGTAFTALDVTDPSTPKYLWEFPAATQLGTGAAQRNEPAGLSWGDSYPNAAPILPIQEVDGSGNKFLHWVVLLNGGFSRNQTAGRGIYMVDALTGALMWKWEYTAGASDDRKYLLYSFAAPPSAVMDPTGGFLRKIVAVDTGGQVWYFDVSSPQTITPGSALATWTGQRIFASAAASGTSSAYAATPNGSTTLDINQYPYRPMFQLATEAYGDNGDVWVFAGTGDRDLIDSQAASTIDDGITIPTQVIDEVCGESPYNTSTYLNRFYAIDADYLAKNVSVGHPGTEDSLVNVGGPPGSVTIAKYSYPYSVAKQGGWMLELPAGWKVNNPADIFDRVVYFTTYSPSPTCGGQTYAGITPCDAAAGQGNLFVLDFQTGLPTINLSNSDSGTGYGKYTGPNGIGAGNLSSSDGSLSLGSGIPSAPHVSLQQEGTQQSGAVVVSSSANSSPVSLSAKTNAALATTLYHLYVPRSLHDTLANYGSAH